MLRNAQGHYANSYWYFPSYWRLLRARLDKLFLIPDRRAPHDSCRTFQVDFITGADMFMHRDVFKECGGFDARYFMNYEETDLQKTVVSHGYHNYIIDGPQITHLEGGSGKARMASRIRVERSMYQYFAKHGGRRLALFAFYVVYSILGMLSFPKYQARENREYAWNVAFQFSALVLGRRV
jgi:GT2 family glycosyltransferase